MYINGRLTDFSDVEQYRVIRGCSNEDSKAVKSSSPPTSEVSEETPANQGRKTCSLKPCIVGRCKNVRKRKSGFRCICKRGYMGKLCDKGE